jgi:uncharacterized membrane protein
MIKKSFGNYILIILFVAFWCAGIIAVPVLKHDGHTNIAAVGNSFFSRVCHQDEARSFYICGEKFGVCIRCTAVYFGFLVGLIFMPLLSGLKQVRVPSVKILLAVILPMAADVVFSNVGLHTSTTMTRVLTGTVFGVAMPWWIVPSYLEACSQLVRKMKKQSSDPGVYPYARETQ